MVLSNRMIYEKVFGPEFFIHSLTYDNSISSSAVIDKKNSAFSPILQSDGRIKQENSSAGRVVTNDDGSKGTNNQAPPLPSLAYLLSNPLVTGKFMKESVKDQLAQQQQREMNETPSLSDDGSLLLPKFLIITHKLNPISVDDFIDALGGCIKRMYDIQKEQFQNLKQNIPHHHFIGGFTVEGVMALPEDRQGGGSSGGGGPVFVPFAGHRIHFNEEMFSRLVDGLSDATSDDLLSTKVVVWLKNVILPYFYNCLPTRKFHFFTFVQTYGQVSMLKTDLSSSFDINVSPLEKLSLELGFPRISKL